MSAGLTQGQVEIAWSTGTIVREPKYWIVKNSQGYANILLGPRSVWRPSTSAASMGVGSGSGPLFKLNALFVPLWSLALLVSGSAGFLWWRRRSIQVPGHCDKCGYNLEGLASEKCPECGTPRAGYVTRVIRALRSVAKATRPVPLGATT